MEKKTTPPLCRALPNAITVLERRYLKRDTEGKGAGKAGRHVSARRKPLRRRSTVCRKSGHRAARGRLLRMMAHLEFLPNSPTLMTRRRAGAAVRLFRFARRFQEDISCGEIHSAHSQVRRRHGIFLFPPASANDVVHDDHRHLQRTDFFHARLRRERRKRSSRAERGAAEHGHFLRVDHPDIMNFIKCKADHKQLNNFNISVDSPRPS